MASTSKKLEAKETPSKKGFFRSLKIIYAFVWPYKAFLFGALFFLVIAASAQLYIFYSLRDVVDSGFSEENANVINNYFQNLLIIGVIWSTALFFRFRLVTLLGERVVADMRKKVHGHLVTLAPVFFETNRPGEISSRLTADTTLIQTVVGSSASIALRSLFMFVGGIILLFVLNSKLMGLMFLVFPVLGFSFLFFGRLIQKRTRSGQDKLAEVGAMAGEAFGSIQVVQAFTQEDQEKSRFSRAVEETYDEARKRVSARSWMMGLITFLFFGAVVLVLWIGAMDVLKGEMSWGDLTAFVGISIVVVGSLAGVTSVYGDIQKMVGAAGRLQELLDEKTPLKIAKNPVLPVKPSKGGVRLDHVTFAYPSKPGVKAIDNISLKVEPGKTIAVVGPSGAGKSTLFQLLLRFFDPLKGTISIDGVDISKMDPKELRNLMTIVPQETILFAETVLQNTRYGRPEASEKEVLQALEDAQAMEFIEGLPEGIQTYLGERGVRLSGGQRQRLAIARAILRNSPILLLDEATSSLDSKSEKAVQKALERLMENRTTIVIAHRLSTVKGADKIVVLDKGRVVAKGRHSQLIKDKGSLYASLAKLQFET